jgi:F-type H+-transporting ATPase subunit gamma
MTSPRELKRRIRTVRNIERTVDAMQKISAARLARVRAATLGGRPYTNALIELVRDLAASGRVSHPLLDVREGEGYMLLAIGADRGMCGAYNANITRAATEFISSRRREKLYFGTAGRRIRLFTPHTSARIIRETLHHHRPLSEADVADIAETVINAYLSRDAVRAYFLYTEFHSATGNRPVVRRILPIMPRPEPSAGERIFEPGPAEILDRLMPLYVRTAVRQAFLEADASEHAARMVTMEQASASARRMISELTLEANRLRQSTITRELADIVGTTEALAA